MLWLRPEMVQTVDWGGDPTNKLLAGNEGADVRLSPRKSFEKWQQTVRGRSRPFGQAELETAAALGQRMQVLILSRARDQMAMAESLQRSVVLDRAPQLSGVDVAARYLPASTFQLAGDWWDAIELDGGRFAFVVGDVAGHGVRAASTMLQLRPSLRAFLFEGHDPMLALDRLDAFVDRMLDHQVATAVVALVDPAARTVDIAAAGHPPAVLSSGTSSRAVEVSLRPVLGTAFPSRKPAARLDLAPGEAMLLYTDGLIERRGEVLDASLARLLEPGLAVGEGSLGDWLDRLLDRVGADRSDDTTLLAFRIP
jgi:serine phosphatase RsbU (regulator of sigma subunit)